MSKLWPFDARLSPLDVFDLVEMAQKDPKTFTPDQLAVLRSDPYGSWKAAQERRQRRHRQATEALMDQELADAVASEIADMLSEHAGSAEPFDWFGTASSIERSLKRDWTAANFDPPDPEFWREMAAELRRRGIPAGGLKSAAARRSVDGGIE